MSNGKSAANGINPGDVFGCIEVLAKIGQNKWQVRCTNCGTIFERTSRSLRESKNNPPSKCRNCNLYKVGDIFGCITLLYQISNITWQVKCNKCGREYPMSISTISKYKTEQLDECGFCSTKKNKPRSHKPGERYGCYELVKFDSGSKWIVKCTKCGREQIQSISNMQKVNAEKCYFCDHPDAIHNPSSSHRVQIEDVDERIYNYYSSRILTDNDKGKKYKEWGLSKDEFKKLIHQNCYYCGTEPSADNMWNNLAKRKNSNDGIVYLNGIDRKDSSKGYTIDNCVPCCSKCNTMKSDLPLDVFYDRIAKIYKFHCSQTIEKHESEPSRVESSDSKWSAADNKISVDDIVGSE